MSKNKLYTLIDSYDPDQPALSVVGGKTTSYGELTARSIEIATGLQASGHQAGDRTLILAELNADTLAYIIALLRIGGVPVVADPGTGRAVLQARIDESSAKWVLLSPALYLIRNHPILQRIIRQKRRDLPYLFRVRLPKNIVIATNKPLPGEISIHTLLGRHKIAKIRQAGDEALIVFTSGTTGSPKGVVHTHKSLTQTVKAMSGLIRHDKPVLYTHQPYFVLLGVVLGAHVILSNKEFSAKLFVENSNKYKPTITFGPPGEFIPVINYLKNKKILFPQSYKQVMFGSAPITQSFLKKFKRVAGTVSATCMYGMTEAIPISSIDMDEKLAWRGQGDILGSAVKGISIKVESEELFVKGNHVIKNYLSKKSQTWIATGDLVSIDADNIILKGRKKDMILRRSYNIYPGLFESTIQNIEGVQACALFGVYDDKLEDERIILAIETEDTVSLTENDILEQLKNGPNSIDANALPDKVVFTKIPRAGRQSKIDKNALQDRYK